MAERTITVMVKAFGGIRDLVGSPLRFELSAHSRVSDLLNAAYERVPGLRERLEDGLARGYLTILLDGRNVRFLSGMETALPDGATVAFLPPVGGG